MVATNKANIGHSPDVKPGRSTTTDFVTPQSAIVSLTDSTTGTASNTLDDTTVNTKDDLASLAAKIEEILAALRTAGIISS